MKEDAHDDMSPGAGMSESQDSAFAQALERAKGRVRELAEGLARGLGLEIWGLELVSGGPGKTQVRLYVEGAGAAPGLSRPAGEGVEEGGADGATGKPGGVSPFAACGVSIDDCAKLSRQLSNALDEEEAANPEFLPGAYSLEVSSPGLSRRFFDPEQLPPYVGEDLFLTLHAPRAGRKRFKGRLERAEDGRLTLSVTDMDGEQVEFAWPEIKKATLEYRFEAASQPAGTPPPKRGHAAKGGGKPAGKSAGKTKPAEKSRP